MTLTDYHSKRSVVINQLQNESDVKWVSVLGRPIADVLKNTAGAQQLGLLDQIWRLTEWLLTLVVPATSTTAELLWLCVA